MSHTDSQKLKTEFRKVQPIHGNSSWVLILPRSFIEQTNIQKGDYVKCMIFEDELRIKKAE